MSPYRSPTIPSVDNNGYGYVENAAWWKDACVSLPCFTALQWPDYDTKIVEDVIDGQPVVIQLWKGWCQKFLGLDDFPGGVGAEVGIYRRLDTVPDLQLPAQIPSPLRHLVEAAERSAEDELWWPYPELQTTLTFEFVNPKTGETLFSCGPETTYWLCKWMDLDSYRCYKRDHRGDAPTWSAKYLLRYTVNGKSYEW